jgi:glycine/sarcosine N-methyltransferase
MICKPKLNGVVRNLANAVAATFDAVISFDNALPHLLTDDDLLRALTGIRRRLRTGGTLLVSTRDYDTMVRDRVRGVTPILLEVDDERLIAGQAWEWE